MKQLNELQKRWRDSVQFRGLHAVPILDKDGLVLGASTLLAKRNHDGALALDGEEARLLTLLAVAYSRPVDLSVLEAIGRASKHARAGDECMAAMHVALAGLPRLQNPSDAARRLFIADSLMNEGVAPRDIWTALDFNSAPLDALDKFDPDQPRVPAGSGRTSGQWTSGDSTGQAEVSGAFLRRPVTGEEITESASGADSYAAVGEEAAGDNWWKPLLELAPRLAGPLAFLSALLYSTPAGGERRKGLVPGRPDLAWEEDEGLLTITDEAGETVLQARRGADGKVRVIYSPAYHRLLNEHSQSEPELPVAPMPDEHDEEPDLCPKPLPDAPQGSARSWAYSDYVKSLINEPPTPSKFGYRLSNPYDSGKQVKYDDCQRMTGSMIEFKGEGYARQLNYKSNSGNIGRQWAGQATRQVEASRGRPVIWIFAEKPAMEFARSLFAEHRYLSKVQALYVPPPWSD
ncbi:MAG: hypothetical protein ABSD74_15325 [Rhizomicrobium sp.]